MSKKFDSGVARGQPQALSLRDFCLPFTGHLFKSDQETFARKPSTLQYSLVFPGIPWGSSAFAAPDAQGAIKVLWVRTAQYIAVWFAEVHFSSV